MFVIFGERIAKFSADEQFISIKHSIEHPKYYGSD